jgi:hypothetical protein
MDCGKANLLLYEPNIWCIDVIHLNAQHAATEDVRLLCEEKKKYLQDTIQGGNLELPFCFRR